MERVLLDEAAELLEKANAGLHREPHPRAEAERLLRAYARVERLAAFGKAALSARLDDPAVLSRVTGTTMGRARQTIATGKRLAQEPRLADAVRRAEVSLDQAEEIARTESVAPGSIDDLLTLARTEAFHVLKDRARAIRLDAMVGDLLAERQHQGRMMRHRVTEIGMIRIEVDLEPHVGTPIVNRLEDQARRLARSARRCGAPDEPFERHLADALPALLAGEGGPSGRAELVVLVSHEVTQRGWHDVRDGEKCSIPGVGPIAPRTARKIAQDAFLSGLFYDGTDLRHLRRWTRSIPTPVRIALNLGAPPAFDGPVCVDCGNRFRLEWDHQEPHVAGGAASTGNLRSRCTPCHAKKTSADRRAGKHRRRAVRELVPP
ncbi:MAG TPA: HNH endonuclease [Acidimicrobiia bacterium]|nr:HNH endonuclease [Acidimicrobiia bacterium]